MARRKEPASGPLFSWDIYMDAYNRRLQRAQDFNALKQLARTARWRQDDFELEKKVIQEGKVVVLTDLNQVIVFASANLREMNGYDPQEVIGNTPRMFQGRNTSDLDRKKIRDALTAHQPIVTTIDNYRKDGTLYTCHVEEYPIWNTDGKVVNFIAFEKIA